ncbi:dienelactone hydrolase family protein [soil metagenome]
MTTAQLRDVRSENLNSGGVDGPPVVILLHGYGSNEDDLTGLVSPLEIEGPWASLRAPVELGNGGAAWFTIVTPGDPDAEPVVAATDAIWSWIDSNVSPTASVVAIGFSQGGLMASQLLRTRPERVRATVILGGFVLGAPQPADEVLAGNPPPVFWGRGDQDRVIAPVAIARTAEFLPQHAALVERVYPGLAHGISADELADVRAFLTANGL